MSANCSDFLAGGVTLTCRKGVFGGIDKIYFLETDKISGFTKDATGTISGVTYVSSATTGFYEFAVEKFTASADDDGKPSATGDFVEQNIALEFVKAQAALRNQVLLLTKRRVTSIVKYNTGKYFVFGETLGLLSNGYGTKGGKAAADLNGYSISLFGTEPDLASEINSTAFTAL